MTYNPATDSYNMDYEILLEEIMSRGTDKSDRTGTGTRSLFGHQLRYDLSQGLPVITTKRIALKSVIHELLWFLKGDTNIKYLTENGVTIWDEWADEDGEIGPCYGFQWRHWGKDREWVDHEGFDQIAELVHNLRFNPNSRRHVVSAWNVADLSDMKLQPCHYAFQCNVRDGKLDLMINQRSCDMFLGVPFNIMSYALLTHMLAQQADLEVGDFIWSGGDCHIYSNHHEQVETQLSRVPFQFPTLQLRKAEDIFSYTYEDFGIVNYNHHPAIKAPVAV